MKKLKRILVVDASRVVRAALAKHLHGEFEVIEEGDGESAWQTLMLDASIAAVISSPQTPRLAACDLLERLRASSLRRLRAVPLLLLVADARKEAEKLARGETGRAGGVAGFVARSMSQAEVVDLLRNLLDGGVAVPVTVAAPAASGGSTPAPGLAPASPAPTGNVRLLANDKFTATLAALSPKSAAEPLCALVFAIDRHAQLIDSFGEDVAKVIAERFASLLLAKVAPQDAIGRWQSDRLAIISHGVDLQQGARFAQRVCTSLAAGQISIRGKKVRLTASVGVASNSDDDVENGRELFALAEQRLEQALFCGGNSVATEVRPGRPERTDDASTLALLDAIGAPEACAAANLATLGMKLLPLLRVMDRELALDLPLARIEQQLQQRAERENAAD